MARGERARQIAEQGVTVRGLAEFTIRVPVTDRPQDIRETDVLLLAVKTYDTQPALASVAHLRAGMALSVQNGVLKDEQLARVFGRDATLGAMAVIGGEVAADGAVRLSINSGLHLGELGGGRSERVDELAGVINAAGVRAFASDAIESVEWSKYVGWMSLTAVSVLTRMFTHEMLQDPDLARLQVMLTREGCLIADELGIRLVNDVYGSHKVEKLSRVAIDEEIVATQQRGRDMEAAGLVNLKLSASQDLDRGRRLEVEETFGYAVRKAAELGVPVPGLETCYLLLSGIDRAGALKRAARLL